MKKNIKDINDNKLKDSLQIQGSHNADLIKFKEQFIKIKLLILQIFNIPKSLINKLNDYYVINSINIKEFPLFK